ncbi:protein transport protein SFT2-like [Xenia sp. Carnegie-2017]|uniref:protein transport protein SFT2-like n=1 Tax=Xenia sp. Carnegie-2017 TaxID=2897299 RepID=UPI001F043047|nr:protein transport protein SFT2-like [Xenia sp. Carnegie-2017]
MDLEAKISSLRSYVKLSAQKDQNGIKQNEKPDNSGTDAESNGWWSSISNKAQEPDPWLPGLTKTQRIVGFFLCLLLGVFCFGMAAMIIPFIILKSRKFVALYTMGSVFTLGSFSLLWGPYHHLKHLLSLERLPFTTMYFGSMFTTLYVAIFIKSTFLTLICAIIQVITLTWYIVSYLPGGTAGMKIMSRFFSNVAIKTVSKTLPV